MISKTESVRRWRKRHPARAKKLYKKVSELERFGTERFIILERDNYKCRSCGSKENLEVHHIDGNGSKIKERSKKNNLLENLIILCRKCHRRADTAMLMEKRKELSLWSLNYKKCIECGKTDSKHASNGVCNRCYNKKRKLYKAEYYRKNCKHKIHYMI